MSMLCLLLLALPAHAVRLAPALPAWRATAPSAAMAAPVAAVTAAPALSALPGNREFSLGDKSYPLPIAADKAVLRLEIAADASPAEARAELDRFFDAIDGKTEASYQLGPFTMNAGMDPQVAKAMVRQLAPAGRAAPAPEVSIVIDPHFDPRQHQIRAWAGPYSRWFYQHEIGSMMRELTLHPLNPARLLAKDVEPLDYSGAARELAKYSVLLAERVGEWTKNDRAEVKGRRFIGAMRALSDAGVAAQYWALGHYVNLSFAVPYAFYGALDSIATPVRELKRAAADKIRPVIGAARAKWLAFRIRNGF